MKSLSKLLVALNVSLLVVACDSRPGTALPQPEPSNPRQAAPATGADLRARQVAFLNRIRAADPQERTIDRALLNEENELGLILDRSVDLDRIPALMRNILTQMAREFPGEDLTVVAYTPSNPPRTIGTARLDARTRDMTYTPRN